ncbi:hypothetical protein [Deinococcus humi]|uniref:DUF306 domain-containing protein n=1 Tax=Deinococcus humi TaxID=662880 RepID=A0A7W8NI90_9DEIO|nr:hypothetical protein [Deinococcus humi]MBB5364802.1 hypothetical protein [Deinococcus humi]GGO34091.1 hypothetical protein GCM10008949_34350 [Deinococcus humi]
MRPLLTLLLVLCTAWTGGLAQSPGQVPAQPPAPPFTHPIEPGQVWTLNAVTAEGETFQTTLHLGPQPPQGTPATYRADRGVLLLDQQHGSLIALDLADAQDGGLALACAYVGPLDARVFEGVLAAAPLKDLPPLLEAALAVFEVASTPETRAEASAELRLGHCRLTLQPQVR